MCMGIKMTSNSVAYGARKCGVKRPRSFSESEQKQMLKNFHVSKIEEARKRARTLNRKNAAPISKGDVSKWLVAEIVKAEKDLHRMFGAVGYAEVQLRESLKRGCCVLCKGNLSSDYDRNRCATSFREKITRTLEFVRFSKSNELRAKYTNQLEKLKSCPVEILGDKPVEQYKRGKIDALRTQKMDSLQHKKCALCERSLSAQELPIFLSVLDRKVVSLKSQLRAEKISN